MTYQASPNFISRQIAGEYILVPVNSDALENNLLMLNETGYFLWQQLQEPKTMNELITSAVSHFESSEEAVQNDIVVFVNGLVRVGLVIERR